MNKFRREPNRHRIRQAPSTFAWPTLRLLILGAAIELVLFVGAWLARPPPLSCNVRFMQPLGMGTSTRRAGEYRQRMRERGYRPVQVWVPDVRSERFVAQAHREALALAEADRRSDDMDFVEAISELADDE
jgi:hypothetical protein